jgi:predicted nucleic acid-binding protein
MIYLDTSCLLKMFLNEADSHSALAAVEAEPVVVVSTLTELEADVQLKAATLGGKLTQSQFRRFQARLMGMRKFDPFHFRALSGAVFQTALAQHRHPKTSYLRALDRLHLAAMQDLGLKRLLTFDQTQAEAALSLGFEVIMPKRA